MSENVRLQIGEVSEEVGLSVRTIRHYEDVHLVEPSERSSGGFRLYSRADVDRLRLVKQLKPLDFSLEEMRDLIDTLQRLDGDLDKSDRRLLVERLSAFAAVTRDRCDRLRSQLDAAEALTEQLRSIALRGRLPEGALLERWNPERP